MRLSNTLSTGPSEFTPLNPGRVSLYVCGPTVYDVPHVGHARAAVVFDVLRRHLIHLGYGVLFVRNITDVDDKIIHRAGHDGVDSAQIAETYTRVYDDAMRSLNVMPADIAPRASGHIPDMIEMIEQLIENGHAYVGGDSVWFAVESTDDYGKLSGRRLDDMRAGERVDPAEGKRYPLDFALWKGVKPGEPSWRSPWGPGRPGWHIECSAMSVRYLGLPIDIHGGGADLIFPHHENEIAQAEAACGLKPFARYWLHNGHVNIDGEKMSKSLKNYVLVEAVLEDYGPDVLRTFFLSAHYRSPMDYTAEALDEAKAVWTRFETFLRSGPTANFDPSDLADFDAAMDDDLNTPKALSALHALCTEGNKQSAAGQSGRAEQLRGAVASALGRLGCEAAPTAGGGELLGSLIDGLLADREQARKDRDFARSDAIRDRLSASGVLVEDSPDGPRWHIS